MPSNTPSSQGVVCFTLIAITITVLILIVGLMGAHRPKPALDAPVSEIVSYCLAAAGNGNGAQQARVSACLDDYGYTVKR